MAHNLKIMQFSVKNVGLFKWCCWEAKSVLLFKKQCLCNLVIVHSESIASGTKCVSLPWFIIIYFCLEFSIENLANKLMFLG